MANGMSIITIFILAASVWIGYQLNSIFQPSPIPNMSRDQYWGPGNIASKDDDTIKPFKIEFTKEMILDLRNRLSQSRYADSFEDTAFHYGFHSKVLKKIITTWVKDYDFSEREKFLNQYPHYKTKIQGLDIHFIHLKPKAGLNKKVIPLLILHGWPGSVREFYKLIPLLMADNSKYDFTFELIVPSLPGYGFSQASFKSGLGAAEVAVIMSNLMHRLGHSRYCIQGGDWGAIIGSHISTLYPHEVIGYHSNLPQIWTPLSSLKLLIGSMWPTLFTEEKYVHRLFPLASKFSIFLEETGYFHIQATKPDTLGVGLDDSPAALAAWILEKFSTGTNIEFKSLPDGGLTQRFTYEELIDNLMFYWVSKSAKTSVRLYTESVTKKQMGLKLNSVPTLVPCAAAVFPHDIFYFTEWQLKEKYVNLIRYTHFDEGGHFAALEVPHLLAEDIWSAVKQFNEFKS